ncbi:hypothetical protein [Pseudoduganella namucuonensis]|uniref:Uncharacterized protein n=1 Tax=Pseudoduganella namucuonensis TaxID=1035707 RepID=A0A1I7KZH3_9BURK|nr:hypothetical protein [Pseudoduganella namucuonensis]SFV02847.1 hypothetical protein SAMN05216552_102173 [Pseudoduganella namucuonensis]
MSRLKKSILWLSTAMLPHGAGATMLHAKMNVERNDVAVVSPPPAIASVNPSGEGHGKTGAQVDTAARAAAIESYRTPLAGDKAGVAGPGLPGDFPLDAELRYANELSTLTIHTVAWQGSFNDFAGPYTPLPRYRPRRSLAAGAPQPYRRLRPWEPGRPYRR